MNRLQRWSVELVGVAFGVATYIWLLKLGGTEVVTSVIHDRSAVYGTLASIFASLLGFVIAAIAIVLGYADSPKLAVVRKSRRWADLWASFTSCMWMLAVATIVALAGLILTPPEPEPPSALLLSTLAGAALAVVLRVSRAVWVLEKVVEAIAHVEDEGPSASREA